MAETFRNLTELCERSCARYAERPLFGERRSHGGGWRWTTYREFHDLVDWARAALAHRGIGAGDRVAIISDNRLEWAVVAYATYGRGAALVPMYPAQRAAERRHILEDAAPKLVFVADETIHRDVAAIESRTVESIVDLGAPATDPRSWAAFIDSGSAEPVAACSPAPETIADFIYTSGTTGKPKGVLLSHENIVSNVRGVHEVFHFEPEDRSLSFLPWAHAYGQTCEVHGLLSMGCSVAINDKLEHLLANLAEVQPTILVAVPSIFNRLYEAVNAEVARRPRVLQRVIRTAIKAATKRSRGETLGTFERLDLAASERLVFRKVRDRFGGRLKYAISASATLSREVASFIDAVGLTVYEGYGLTETSPIVSANFPGRRRLGSVGRPIGGVRVAIEGAAPGEIGEIIVYGPNVMTGYHRQPEETAQSFTKDGGLRTGDLGYVDDDGYLYIAGRIKEQYKLDNGKYIMPSPLEEELKRSPYIANVMLFGDGRPFNVCLVVLNEPAVRAWANAEGITLGSEVTRDERVRALVRDEIELRAETFKPFARPRRFALITEDFTAANGLLTPTLKVRRKDVLARYGDLLESLYPAYPLHPPPDVPAAPPSGRRRSLSEQIEKAPVE